MEFSPLRRWFFTREIFGRNAEWSVRIAGRSTSFVVPPGKDLLSSALEQGIAWPHFCRQGSCTTCKCRIVSGKTRARTDFETVLTPDQIKDGWILACESELRSNIVVEVELDDMPQAVVTHHKGTLISMDALTHDIVEVKVRIDDEFKHVGAAGQYAELRYPGLSVPRSYSFAKAPANERPGELTFYIRKVPEGEFSEWLFGEDRVGTELEVSLPYGNFRYHEDSEPMVCIAGGSGMSAVKAVLEQAVLDQVERDALFLFGARTQADLYGQQAIAEIQQGWNPQYRCEYAPVLSMEPEDSDWAGARGLVTDYLKEAYLEPKVYDIARCQGYLCGPPAMIDAAMETLQAEGMDESRIHFDKFLDASSMPGGRPKE